MPSSTSPPGVSNIEWTAATGESWWSTRSEPAHEPSRPGNSLRGGSRPLRLPPSRPRQPRSECASVLVGRDPLALDILHHFAVLPAGLGTCCCSSHPVHT